MSSHCSPACGNFRSSSSSTLFYLSAPSGLDILQRLPGMSVAFVPDWLRGSAEVNQETIQRLLEENDQLIRCIVEYQNKGRANECVQYQHVLHRNLIYLATIADASPAGTSKAE
ncbi:SS18-like protein 2 isoform X1 [Lepus europaeus]|uniref:SS18-like protein 2 isoform X1 n=1 Tax=Lepus europaeus TaxID=9983 RepID=UPI002B466E8D|nr:SS18-like protein 2 isoform X1 [Lepus europaeus]